MRLILFILLLVSQFATAQFGNKNFAFRSPITTPTNEFNWDALVTQSPTTYTSQSNLIIEWKKFTNLNSVNQGGNNLVLNSCSNITIRNCYFGSSWGLGVAISNSTNITIENCFFANNKSGVYVDGASQDIVVQDCQAINQHGPFPRGQFVQFNGTTTSASGQCAVRRNAVEEFLGESHAEDIINMFNSSGRSGAPIDISDNLLRGGGPSMSGGGILLGESSGDWNLANNNKLYQVGNYIVAVGGGSNNTMTNNMGYLDHTLISVDNWSNVGYVLWAQQVYSLPFDNLTFTNNINFTNTARFGRNPLFYPTAVTGTVQYDNSDWYSIGQENIFLTMLDFPEIIITYVTEDILWQIRDESQQFRVSGWLARPTSNAGADQNITISTATLSGAASTSVNGKNYRWTQVSGPNTATMSASLAVTNNLSGLITGTYRFRLEVLDNDGAGDASWVNITVVLT